MWTFKFCHSHGDLYFYLCACKEHPFLHLPLFSSLYTPQCVLKCMSDQDLKTLAAMSAILFEARGILMTDIVCRRISRPAVKLAMER